MATIVEIMARLSADTSDYMRGMSAAEREARQFSRTADATAGQVEKSHGRLGQSALALGGIMKGAAIGGALALGTGLVAAGKMGLSAASDYQQSTIAFTTMLGSASAAQEEMAYLRKFAAETPFELPEITSATKNMLAFGFSLDQTKTMMRAVGDAASGLGTGSGGMQSMIMALGQMKAKGKASSEEIMQLAGQGVPALQYLADAFGVTTAEVGEMMSKGLIPADKAIEAITNGMANGSKNAKGFGGMMKAQSESLQGVWSTLVDTFRNGLVDAIMPYVPALSRMVKAAAPIVEKVLPLFMKGLAGIVKGAVGLGKFLIEPLKAAKELWLDFASGMGGASEGMEGIRGFAQNLGYALGDVSQYLEYFRNGLSLTDGPGKDFGGVIWNIGAAINSFVTTLQGGENIFRSGFLKTVGDAGKRLFEFGQVVKANVMPVLDALGSALTTYVLPTLAKIGEALFTYVVPALVKMYEAILGLIETVLPPLKRFLMEIIAVAGPAFAEIGNTIATKVIPVIGEVIGWLGKFIGFLAPIVAWLLNTLRPVVVGVFSAVLGIISGALTTIMGIVNVFIGLFTGDWQRMWDGVKDIFRGAARAVSAVLSNLGPVLMGILKFLLGAVVGIFGLMWRLSIAGFRRSAGLVTAIVRGLGRAVVNFLRTMGSNAVTAVRNAFGRLVTALANKITDAVGKVRAFPGRVRSALGNLGGYLYNAGWSLISGLANGIMDRARSLYDSVAGIASKIRGYFPGSPVKEGPLKSWNNGGAGKRLVGMLADGLKQTDPITRASRKMAGSVIAPVGPSVGSVGRNAVMGRRSQDVQPTVITFESDGSEYSDWLLGQVRKAIRVRGGNVQLVLGANK